MAKQKNSVLKRYRITFYERIISEWDPDQVNEILSPIEVKQYTKRQAEFVGRKHLRKLGYVGRDNYYGSVEYKYECHAEEIGIVSEEEKLKDKEKKERKKNRKKREKHGYEQMSLFDDNEDEDKKK